MGDATGTTCQLAIPFKVSVSICTHPLYILRGKEKRSVIVVMVCRPKHLTDRLKFYTFP